MAQKIYLEDVAAHPDPQTLSKGESDSVKWVSRDTAYVVDSRNGSPFTGGKVFNIPAKGSKRSGKIKSNAPNRSYKYWLIQPSTGRQDDPDVEILP